MEKDKLFKVGTFYHPDRTLCKSHIEAYTLWYSPEWTGCVEYKVVATSGSNAKKKAVLKRLAHEKHMEETHG